MSGTSIEDYAKHGVRFFHEETAGRWMPSDNAPSHIHTFIFRQNPRVDLNLLYAAYKYLAYNEQLPEYGAPKYLKWLAEDPNGSPHITEILNQKVVPKSYDELLKKAYFYEFQRVVNLLRKHYSDLITIK